MDKRESLALKQIRSAARDAEARGDAAALAALPGQIDALIANGASEELATALRNLRQVRAHYRAIDDAALLVRVGELGDEHGYDRATEDEGDEGRGPEYVLDFLNTPSQWDEAYDTQENADFIAKKLGTTAARLTRLDWWPAYVAGLIAGYSRRGQELAEPVLLGWAIGQDGVLIRAVARGGAEAFGQACRMAFEQITDREGQEAEELFDSVTSLGDGQVEPDPRVEHGLQELFPWRIHGLTEIEYSENCEEIEQADFRREAIESKDEWPEYYKFNGGFALYFADAGRCGVVFNGDAVWTDAKSIEEGVGRVVLGQVIE